MLLKVALCSESSSPDQECQGSGVSLKNSSVYMQCVKFLHSLAFFFTKAKRNRTVLTRKGNLNGEPPSKSPALTNKLTRTVSFFTHRSWSFAVFLLCRKRVLTAVAC